MLEGPALKFVAASHSMIHHSNTRSSVSILGSYICIYSYIIQRADKLPSKKGPLIVKYVVDLFFKI